ncbi:hypothetical protein Dip518_000394 [Parelusimicrobium proximum]|uniref:hypothetical protein n=1 Tax=Parelusimicrobium proximum TaxID=3228953 RepID=UPI003D17F8B0
MKNTILTILVFSFILVNAPRVYAEVPELTREEIAAIIKENQENKEKLQSKKNIIRSAEQITGGTAIVAGFSEFSLNTLKLQQEVYALQLGKKAGNEYIKSASKFAKASKVANKIRKTSTVAFVLSGIIDLATMASSVDNPLNSPGADTARIKKAAEENPALLLGNGSITSSALSWDAIYRTAQDYPEFAQYVRDIHATVKLSHDYRHIDTDNLMKKIEAETNSTWPAFFSYTAKFYSDLHNREDEFIAQKQREEIKNLKESMKDIKTKLSANNGW